MREDGARRLAWSAFLLWGLFFLGSLALPLATMRPPRELALHGTDILFSLSTSAFPVVAILILSRQPRNRIGWILMAIGLGWALPLGAYGDFAISRGLPGGVLSNAISSPLWAPSIGLMG